MKKYFRPQKGFTLLEILLVVAAIGILAGIVILAINPAKQLSDTRNAQRRANVNTILNAVYQYAIDNNGNFPSPGYASSTIGTTTAEICKSGVASTTCAASNLIDLSALTLNEKYLTAIPQDPNGNCNVNGVCYEILRTAGGRITVWAPDAENSATIRVTR